ncbi:MAG: sodium:proton antiporter [Erysipelotrichaceae bacterium]|nr:sodium:proton antiporter [Erysipelotrichaceae bacterium]
MLISIAYIIIIGLLMGKIFKVLKLPALMGMLIAGIIIGPFGLNLIDDTILNVSSELRKIALIIILIRAGLNLDLNDLKKIGRPAILMSFVPACFEILGMIIIGKLLLGLSILDCALLGSVIAAVSPAVVVPKMLNIMQEGYGLDKRIPQLILAGASIDDVFVIVMFYTFLGLSLGDSVSLINFINIPLSIILGIILGLLIGKILSLYFRNFHIRDSIKVILLLSISFILVYIEDNYSNIINFSSLIAIMSIGVSLLKNEQLVAKRLSLKFEQLWVSAEIFLFVLVGASVNINYAFTIGFKSILIIFIVLLFRMVGVLVSLIKTNLNYKERLFCMLGYTPKATVQAAIGGIALSMGIESGDIILTIAVVSILVSAPLGAFMIDLTYKKLLNKS